MFGRDRAGRFIELHVNDRKVNAGSCITGTVRLITKERGPIHLLIEGKEETVIEEKRKSSHGHVYTHAESKLFSTRKVILDQGTGDNYPFRVDLPEDWPSSMACVVSHGQCEIRYTLTASMYSPRMSVSDSTKLEVLQKPSESDSSLKIKAGSLIRLTRSHFCGLWETPIDTWPLISSLDSIRLRPGQAFFVQFEDFKNLLKRQGSRMVMKLSESIDWTAQRYEPNGRFRDSWELPLSENGEAHIPPDLRMTYEKGHLLQVQHELIVFVHDSEWQVLATANRIPVRVVMAEGSSASPSVNSVSDCRRSLYSVQPTYDMWEGTVFAKRSIR